MRFLFLWFCGGALLPFVLRACCGGMCWPVDRPATHAAAGAAARGVRGIGGRIRCAGRPQEWSCGAVPPQEWMARGGLVFVFSLEVAPVSEGDSFTRSGAAARGVRGIGGLFHTLGRGCEKIPLSSASASLPVQSLRDSAPLPDDDRRANSNNPRGAIRRIKRAG